MAGPSFPVPEKRDVLRFLLEQGQPVRILLDARHPAVLVPPRFKGTPQLILEIGMKMNPPIPDLELDDVGVRCTLSFSKQPFPCVLPWSAIWSVVGKHDGKGYQWASDIPPEIVAVPQAPPPPKMPPVLRAIKPAPEPAPEPADAMNADEIRRVTEALLGSGNALVADVTRALRALLGASTPLAADARRILQAMRTTMPPSPEVVRDFEELLSADDPLVADVRQAMEALMATGALPTDDPDGLADAAIAETKKREEELVRVAAEKAAAEKAAAEKAAAEKAAKAAEEAPSKPVTDEPIDESEPPRPTGKKKRELPSYLRVIKLPMGLLARKAALYAGLLGLALAIEFTMSSVVTDSSLRQLILTAAINALVALSLNIINGMAGQFSIGHAGFVGVGAYTAAVLMANMHQAWPGDISFARSFVMVPASVGAAALVSALFGLLVGLPSLRLRGDYLAIVTLGFAEIFRLLIATAASGDGGLLSKLGGQNGYAGPTDQGIPQYAGPFWVFGAVFAAVVICYRLKFSGWGRALRALREDEIAAAAVGVDPTRYKVTSFVLAAGGAGVAGGLLSTMRDGSPITQPDQFNFQASFDAITMVILGGSGSVSGAVLGALFVTFTIKAFEFLQSTGAVVDFRTAHPWLDLNALRMVIYAATLIAVMILRPEGVFGERELGQKRRG